MHKKITFKIHRQRLTLNSQAKCCRQEQKLKKVKEQKLDDQKLIFKNLRKSKSMFSKISEKQNASPSLLPSFKVQQKNIQISAQDNIWHNIILNSGSQNIQSLITSFMSLLLKKQYKFQELKSSFLIEKTFFVRILQHFFSILIGENNSKCHKSFDGDEECGSIYQELLACYDKSPNHAKKVNLGIISSLISEKISSEEQALSESLKQEEKKIVYNNLNSNIAYLYKQRQSLKDQNQKLTHALQEKSSECCQIDYYMKQMQQICCSLQQQRSDLQKDNLEAKIESEKIYNYIDHQRNDILKMASKEYKQIESDLYEYASYLQANVLASAFDYEPHPYKQIQALLKNELESLAPHQGIKADQNSKIFELLAFLRKMHSFLGKKDCEVDKLLEFKTRCIRNFIKNMKMWLDNWTLKQEYLTNLRVCFAAEANKFKSAISTLKDQVMESASNQQARESLQAIEECFGKLEENYKLGNSFY